jgi:hypothetical protein
MSLIYICLPVAFILGYVVGRLDLIAGRLAVALGAETQSSFIPQNSARKNSTVAPGVSSVKIDEAKVVLPINTAGMQNVSQIELGKTTAVADDINSAASRLAQLKGN